METSQFVSISLTVGYFDVNDCADLVSTGKGGWCVTIYVSHIPSLCHGAVKLKSRGIFPVSLSFNRIFIIF